VAGTALVGTAALSGYMFLVDPNNPSNLYPKCPLKIITGIDCPGCGGLRATNALLHGDIMGAVDHNILALVLLPLMLYALLRVVMAQFDRTPPVPTRPFVRWSSRWPCSFTVVRNIPVGRCLPRLRLTHHGRCRCRRRTQTPGWG
jgi:hypothetical protein